MLRPDQPVIENRRPAVSVRGYSAHTTTTVSWAVGYLTVAEFDWLSTGILSLYIVTAIVFDLQGDLLRRTILGVAALRAVDRGPRRITTRRIRRRPLIEVVGG